MSKERKPEWWPKGLPWSPTPHPRRYVVQAGTAGFGEIYNDVCPTLASATAAAIHALNSFSKGKEVTVFEDGLAVRVVIPLAEGDYAISHVH